MAKAPRKPATRTLGRVGVDDRESVPIILNFLGWRPQEVEAEIERLGHEAPWLMSPKEFRAIFEAVDVKEAAKWTVDDHGQQVIAGALFLSPDSLRTGQLEAALSRANGYIETRIEGDGLGYIPEAILKLRNALRSILAKLDVASNPDTKEKAVRYWQERIRALEASSGEAAD